MGIISLELNRSSDIKITSKDISLMMYLLGQDATVDSEV